jgi:hypothetical protein
MLEALVASMNLKDIIELEQKQTDGRNTAYNE